MVMDSLVLQTKLVLQDDMGFEIEKVDTTSTENDMLKLKDYTSMIGVGGKLNLMVVISYEKRMLEKLVEIFLDGETIEAEEVDEVRDSVAGEVINTIMGLSLPIFPNRGKGVTITPPITTNDASSLVKHKNSKIISAEILTNFGALSISAIGTQETLK
jgi:CheY-specific phosphatase CheX